jgi:hypothetical protein
MDSHFAIIEAQPPLLFHYLNMIFTGEAATWFRYYFRSTDPATLTWDTVRTELLAYFLKPNDSRRLGDQWAETQPVPYSSSMTSRDWPEQSLAVCQF